MFTEELQALEEELSKIPPDVSLGSPSGTIWRQKIERMHVLGARYRQALQLAMQELQARAKLLVMTVDGCVQGLSGLAVHSQWLQRVQFKVLVVEECQQPEHALITLIVYTPDDFVLLVISDLHGPLSS